jgi:hypothetical protein
MPISHLSAPERVRLLASPIQVMAVLEAEKRRANDPRAED